MELSIFLAKLLGIYLLIVALDLLLRRKEVEGAARDFAASRGLLFFSGSLSLLMGLAIVIGHPVYSHDWRGLITLLGYVLVVRGVLKVAFPGRYQKRMGSLFHKNYWLLFLIILILGAFLTYSGFNTVYVPCEM